MPLMQPLPSSSLTLRQVRYFVAVAEAGKVASAATTIGISPSAITEAVQELEALTGVQLITRHRNGVKLTYDGYVFLQHCRNILSAVSAATYAVGAGQTQLKGRLVLASTITVAGYFLATPLARFRRTFPEVDVRVRELSRLVIERQLRAGQLDLAVVLVSNLAKDADFATETLIRSKRRLWTPAKHRLLEQEQVSLADVAEEPYIQLLIDEAEKTTLRYWARYHSRPRTVFRTDSVEAVRSMVATGAGVTILSDMVYRPWSLEGDRLESKDVVNDIPTMDVGLAWRRGRPLKDTARAFVDFCRMEFTSGRLRSAE